jgi:hypothetical protein
MSPEDAHKRSRVQFRSTRVAGRSTVRRRGPKRRERVREVFKLPRAGEFSDDGRLGDPVWVISALKLFPQFYDKLRQATLLEYPGRGRRGYRDGDWTLVYLAHVMSANANWERWWSDNRSSRLWQAAGFESTPSYGSLYAHFVRLEEHIADVAQVKNLIVRHARSKDSRIGVATTFDTTPWHSQARLHHCCPDSTECARRSKLARRKPPKTLQRADDADITREHNAETAQPEDEAGKVNDSELSALQETEEWGELAADPRWHYLWLGSGETRPLFRTLDRDVSGRTYQSKRGGRKVWTGGRRGIAADLYTGLAYADDFESNRVEERHIFFTAYEAAVDTLGEDLAIVAGDRGLHFADVIEHNTRRGAATVMPWREPSKDVRRKDVANDKFDRHGVPRCQHCGAVGITNLAGYGFHYDQRAEPRIAFRCSLGKRTDFADCGKRQTIACSENWTMLLPIDLTEEVYYAVKGASKNREHSHRDSRSRGAVAGKDYTSRLKRMNINAHRLRGAAQMLLDWFRISLRHAWLTADGLQVKLNTEQPVRIDGGKWWQRVLDTRRRLGLNLPAGAIADKARTMNAKLPPPDGPDPGDEVDAPPPPDSGDRDYRPF